MPSFGSSSRALLHVRKWRSAMRMWAAREPLPVARIVSKRDFFGFASQDDRKSPGLVPKLVGILWLLDLKKLLNSWCGLEKLQTFTMIMILWFWYISFKETGLEIGYIHLLLIISLLLCSWSLRLLSCVFFIDVLHISTYTVYEIICVCN